MSSSQQFRTNTEYAQNSQKILTCLESIFEILTQNKLELVFDTMGGEKLENMVVFKNQTFGNLPIPTRPNYDFRGWYTKVIPSHSTFDGLSSPVYRLFNPRSNSYFYTINNTEKDFKIKNGWELDGVAFYAYDFPYENTKPIYRFTKDSNHFLFTSSESEKTELINNPDLGWDYDKILGYVFSDQEWYSTPLYHIKYTNGGTETHILEPSPKETRNLVSDQSFELMGVVGFVIPTTLGSNDQYRYLNQTLNLTTVSQSGTLNLYAKWEPSWKTIWLNPNGGSVNPDAISVQYTDVFANAIQGHDLSRGLPIPTKPSRTFDCWEYSDGISVLSVSNDSHFLYDGITELSARWVDEMFTLEFDLNGADGFLEPLEIPAGTWYDLSSHQWSLISSDVHNDGYRFLGWSRTPRAHDIIQTVDGHTILEVSRNQKVYAIWENEQYQIEYYDLYGNLVHTQKSKLNVPDCLTWVEDLPGNFRNFDHWDSDPGTYAGYLMPSDGALVYNLGSTHNETVKLSASSTGISNEVEYLSSDLSFSDFQSQIGSKPKLPDHSVFAKFSDQTELQDVTKACRIYPSIITPETTEIIISFKYDGTETVVKTV